MEYQEKSIYLYLDFHGKANIECSKTGDTFLRIADLDKKNPLVQLNDMLFKGTYEDCVGTNLFFTEEEDSPVVDCFKKETSISLKYLLSQNKILCLENVKVDNILDEPADQSNCEFDLNLKHDYNASLKKLVAGEINLEDLRAVPREENERSTDKETDEQNASTSGNMNESAKEDQAEIDGHVQMASVGDVDDENQGGISEEKNAEILSKNGQLSEGDKHGQHTNTEYDKYGQDTNTEDDKHGQDTNTLVSTANLEKKLEEIPPETDPRSLVLLEKYEKLKELARRPVYRETKPEVVEECEAMYKQSYEYHNIERQIFQRSDSFPLLDFNIDERTLKNAVDIDRCILQNMVPSTIRDQRFLSQHVKDKLLTFENFPNLSLPARYSVLKTALANLQTVIDSSSEEELNNVDQFGRTSLDTLNILKKLVSNLENYLSDAKNNLGT